MKKILCFIAIALMGMVATFGQTVSLSFTGRDSADHYVQLDYVTVTNLTKGWQETIYYPDTIVVMGETGIDDTKTLCTSSLHLSQNNPNPFIGITNVNLTVADAGAITLEIVDGNGRIAVETTHALSLQPGTHQFRVSLSAAGTYVMTARQNGKTSSIKMVCNGAGNGNGIEYFGTIAVTPKSHLRGRTNNPFDIGDLMEYVGYATINSTQCESQHISQTLETSQTIVLHFTETQGQQDGQPCPGTPTVTDIDGNVYNTVQIGTQCWMKENLRTTHYADETAIPFGGDLSCEEEESYNYSEDAPLYYNNLEVSTPLCGYLYNWASIMHGGASSNSNPSGVQGICPNGWHLPSASEWGQLTAYVSGQPQYVCGEYSEWIAKALSAVSNGWSQWCCDPLDISDYYDECSPGLDISSNNATGFSALPSYLIDAVSDENKVWLYGELPVAAFWTSTQTSPNVANEILIYGVYGFVFDSSSDFEEDGMMKSNGLSVRCVKD